MLKAGSAIRELHDIFENPPQEYFAYKIGVSQPTVNKWLNGKAEVTKEKAINICVKNKDFEFFTMWQYEQRMLAYKEYKKQLEQLGKEAS